MKWFSLLYLLGILFITFNCTVYYTKQFKTKNKSSLKIAGWELRDFNFTAFSGTGGVPKEKVESTIIYGIHFLAYREFSRDTTKHIPFDYDIEIDSLFIGFPAIGETKTLGFKTKSGSIYCPDHNITPFQDFYSGMGHVTDYTYAQKSFNFGIIEIPNDVNELIVQFTVKIIYPMKNKVRTKNIKLKMRRKESAFPFFILD